MIFGIGIDTIEIERIKKLLSKPNLTRLFSQKEIDYAKSKGSPEASLAGAFAAKEAVLKAFGTGFSGVGYRDVEVYHEENGAPKIKLYGQALVFAEKNQICQIHLSISHDRTKAVAMVLAEKTGDCK